MDGSISPQLAAVQTRGWETPGGIERWLSDQVAGIARTTIDEIDVTQPFSHYALDSVATVELTADLEDWLELRLPPTLLWDYPSIAVLARHLHEMKVGAP